MDYQKRLKHSNEQIAAVKKKVNLLVVGRLVVFVGGITAIIYSWGIPWLAVLEAIVTAFSFGVLVKLHIARKEEKSYWDALTLFYSNEIKGLDGDWSFAGPGDHYKSSDHDFAHDIDLFGERSFFQRVNRTGLNGGERRLAELMLSNDNTKVAEFQDANKELRDKHEFNEGFIGYSRVHSSEVSSDLLKKWLVNYKPFLPKWIKVLSFGFSFLSIGVIALFGLNLISGVLLSGWLILGLSLIGIWLKSITKLNTEIHQIVYSIKSYDKLLRLIEDERFKSSYLHQLEKSIEREGGFASKVIKDLSKAIDLFNNRNNLLIAIMGNGFLLWDLHTTYRIEKWLVNHSNDVVKWLDTLYEFDAVISLAIYANSHTNYVYPILLENGNIDAVSLGHPLIKESECITNDVKLLPENFLIITGANMAGKSTFLRTISLSLLMTNLGLPVFAEEFKVKPQKLITSMRSTDSLLEDESYFFAELKRLKFIIDRIEKESYFIILDEILKGTNSKDKEEGSRKFVSRLVALKATGLIATHDLGLCEIEKEHGEVKNFYFDAEIVDDELHFDYKMKYGVCKNMNASFLLRKMKIVSN